jgi:hypothetical protein
MIPIFSADDVEAGAVFNCTVEQVHRKFGVFMKFELFMPTRMAARAVVLSVTRAQQKARELASGAGHVAGSRVGACALR